MASEVIDIRRFRGREFLPVLCQEGQAWAANLHWDFERSQATIVKCLEEMRLSGFTILEDGLIKGYCFFFYEEEKGLIGNLFVEPSSPRLDYAQRLLDHSLETLIATPGIRRVEMQLPHFSFEALEPYFRQHTFRGFLRRFMVLPLSNRMAGTPSAREPESGEDRPYQPRDFSMEPWDRRYDRQAAQLIYITYRNHIDAAINNQYASESGAARLIENIVHHRGCGDLLNKASLVAVHRPTRRLAGLLALTEVRQDTAHIPQVAVAPEFQGLGIGTMLMARGFEECVGQGFQEVSLTVTDSNAGAVRLYERLGFRTLHTFGAFVWNRPTV